MSTQSYIYFIRPIGADGPIKVGCSNTPHRRLEAIMTWSPILLELIGSVPDCDIDHINGNRADNRMTNLRLATRLQNSCNRKRHTTNQSGVKGVFWHKATGKWSADITAAGRKHHLGVFDLLEDAAEARRIAAEALHGEFARAA